LANHHQQATVAGQGRPVLSVVQEDCVRVAVHLNGQQFNFRFSAPDMRGNIMATDLNDRWLKKQIGDMLKSRFGRMLCNS
jgi:hypothetical protein